MHMVTRNETTVDRQDANRSITGTVSVDLPGAHPDINRIRQQRANRLGHVCRECRNPGCVGERRNEHEITFACAESSALLNAAAYFACPACRRDNRTIPGCQPAVT